MQEAIIAEANFWMNPVSMLLEESGRRVNKDSKNLGKLTSVHKRGQSRLGSCFLGKVV